MRTAKRVFLATALAVLACVVFWSQNVAAEKPKDEAKPANAGQLDRDFEAFVKEPTKANYLRVHRAVTTAETYQPYSMDLEDVDKLVEDGKFEEARSRLKKAMPGLILCPKAHALASRVARALGDTATADKEAPLAKKCIEGILSTGDGNPERPYMITRVSDEYDVLRHLKKTVAQQGVMNKDGKTLDRMQCDDGTEYCFDVTVLFKSMK